MPNASRSTTAVRSASARRCAKGSSTRPANHKDRHVSTLQTVIESAWERRTELGPTRADLEVREAVEESLAGLDSGELRVAEQRDGRWVVNQWLKQAVLLSFRINDNRVVEAGHTRFFDKVPQKFTSFDTE